MKVLIPGGGGYVGASLVPCLLARGHEVTVFDTFLFGDPFLPNNPKVKIIHGDVRSGDFMEVFRGQDAVIYLAGITSDELCRRKPDVAVEVNNAVYHAVCSAADWEVKRFIFASSVAAYGNADNAVEEQKLDPSTLYGRHKADAEAMVLGRHKNATVVRSASVCGYSPRMRFDLTVNRMVRDAVLKGVVTVNGGEQSRCHVNIFDLCNFYALLLDLGVDYTTGVFNVVAVNERVVDTAAMVAAITDAKVEIGPSTDNRSYTVNGGKAFERLGFAPKWDVERAVREIKAHFDDGRWKDAITNQKYMNLVDDLV